MGPLQRHHKTPTVPVPAHLLPPTSYRLPPTPPPTPQAVESRKKSAEMAAAASLLASFSSRPEASPHTIPRDVAFETFALGIGENPNSDLDLYALGGTVTAVKIDGYPQHAPRFRAVAELDGQRAEAVEGNKKTAEIAAAALLLDALPLELRKNESPAAS